MIILSAALTSFAAPTVQAQGQIRLHVFDCNGAATILSACSSNSGLIKLVGSVLVSGPVSGVTAMAANVGLLDCAGSIMSPWWSLQPGGCRDGSLTASFDFTPVDVNGSPVYTWSRDPWSGFGAGSVTVSSVGTDQEAISTTPTLPPGTTASFDPLNESYLFMLGIDKQHTLPPSACTGCTDTAVLYVQSVTLTGSGGDQVMYATGAPGEAVYYNDGGIPDGPPNFCIPVPTHHSTWGSIKAIYR